MGCAVYINGTFIPGNSVVNPHATHVMGFIPFIVDITDKVNFGSTENVLAVRISNNSGVLFADPNFGMSFRFGQQDGGLFRPVYMHITDKVYIPGQCVFGGKQVGHLRGHGVGDRRARQRSG